MVRVRVSLVVMRSFRRAAAVSTSAVIGSMVAAGSADAVADPPNITAIVVHDVRISSDDCRNIPITARFVSNGWRVDGINSKIFYKGEEVGFTAARPADADATTASTTVKWCPSSGLGRYVAGPSTITYYNPNGAGSKTVDDATSAAFAVRRDARVKLVNADVSAAGRASVQARLRAYSLSRHRYTGVRGATVALQTKRVGGHWSTVDSAVTGPRGAVSLGANGKRLWRVVSHATGQVAGAVSRTFD